MSEAKFTPGPWEVQVTESDQFVTENSGNIIATVHDHYLPGRTEANARLIAAAPEMYEMLNLFASAKTQKDIDELYFEADRLITKING